MQIILDFAPTVASRHCERSEAIQAICLLSGLLRASQLENSTIQSESREAVFLHVLQVL